MYFIQYYDSNVNDWEFISSDWFSVYELAFETLIIIRKEAPDSKYRLLKCEALDD